jgi:RNA-directed DNA polymerase
MNKLEVYTNINWKKAHTWVETNQSKIAIAMQRGNKKEVRRIQELIVRHPYAKAVAIKRVVTNSGGKTPGVDGEVWNTKDILEKAYRKLLNLSCYRAEPVRRVYIPKGNGKMRPLGIPSMFDRAVQALHLLALAPVAEQQADSRSYGFRRYHSAHDAIKYIKLVLGSRTCRKRYVLERDLKGYFDNIAHEYMMEHVLMNKRILKEFIEAGYVYRGVKEDTLKGVPQGGIISPTLANMVLDGIQKFVEAQGMIVVRYADDFVVLGETPEQIQNFKIALEVFLKSRGVEINHEKTKITEISEGFDFLGFNLKEYPNPARMGGTKKGIFLLHPSAKNLGKLKMKIREIIKGAGSGPMYAAIVKLNRLLRGWSEYFRYASSSRIFNTVDRYVFRLMWSMLKRKHRNFTVGMIRKKYYKTVGSNQWVFHCQDAVHQTLLIFRTRTAIIRRHIICKSVNPFIPENRNYFKRRKRSIDYVSASLNAKHRRLLKRQFGECSVCGQALMDGSKLEVHHIVPQKWGRDENVENLLLIHKDCHRQVTNTSGSPNLLAFWKKSGIVKDPTWI